MPDAPFPPVPPPPPFPAGPVAGPDTSPEALGLADTEPVALYREAVRGATGGEPVYEFALTPLDRTGVPTWTTAQWQPDGFFCSGNGYGATFDAARIGAWGELTEEVAAHRALPRMTRRRASYADLVREGASAVDPLALRLPVGTDYTPDQERVWVHATRHAPGTDRDGETVWLPIEEAASCFSDLPDELADYRPLYTPITNGMGAGDTRERAVAHGLMELWQRDGNSARYRAMDRGVVVDVALEDVADEAVRQLLAGYDAAGIDVQVKLADTALGLTNVYVVGRERDAAAAGHPIMLTGCGEASHPDRDVALAKAAYEFASSRVRKRFSHGPWADVARVAPAAYVERMKAQPPPVEEDRSLDSLRAWLDKGPDAMQAMIADSVFRETRRVPFSDLPTTDVRLETPADVLATVTDRMADEGLDVYVVDYTADGLPSGTAHAVKVVVPGLEVETMTYDRVGLRNVRRMVEDGPPPGAPGPLAGFGESPEGARPVPLTDADRQAAGPVWFHPGRAAAVVGPLYALYREPWRHVLAALGATEAAGDGASAPAGGPPPAADDR